MLGNKAVKATLFMSVLTLAGMMPLQASAECKLTATQDGSPLVIKPEMIDTPEAKQFMETCKNPYIGNAEATKRGQKLFQLYSCTACHGGKAEGAVGPNLHGPNFKYGKNITNKGMFETIWHGTNGGMGAKGKGLMDPTDPENGLSVDEVLKVVAWVRTHNTSFNGNE